MPVPFSVPALPRVCVPWPQTGGWPSGLDSVGPTGIKELSLTEDVTAGSVRLPARRGHAPWPLQFSEVPLQGFVTRHPAPPLLLGSPSHSGWNLTLAPGNLSASSSVYTGNPFILTDLISWLTEEPGEIVVMRLKRKQDQI